MGREGARTVPHAGRKCERGVSRADAGIRVEHGAGSLTYCSAKMWGNRRPRHRMPGRVDGRALLTQSRGDAKAHPDMGCRGMADGKEREMAARERKERRDGAQAPRHGMSGALPWPVVGSERFKKYCSHSAEGKQGGLFGFWLPPSPRLWRTSRFGSVTGRCGHAPSPKPRQNPKIPAPNGHT